ncbi:unnamed protein product [Cylindrotheca closterium]|uniref:DUF937 domain-containing protein n=1 Tax=Cylindrotheca closterium TaxID=2856 RepID=A0AAD2CWU9_9STRA|nr:unnamed protein product [Cylindrotheca closterium]
MDQLMKLAGDAGLSEEQGKTATGGIMSMVKQNLDSGSYQKIVQQVPEVEGLVKDSDKEATGGGGGLMGQAMGMMGGSLGGAGQAGSIASLLTLMQSKGIGAEQMNAFMPQLAAFIKSKCGVDIGSQLGVSADGAAAPAPAAGGFDASKLGGMMGGMFGK